MAYTNAYLERHLEVDCEENDATYRLIFAYQETKRNGWETIVIRDLGFPCDAMDMVEAMDLLEVNDVIIADESTALMSYLTRLIACGWKVVGTSTVKRDVHYTFGYNGEINGLHLKRR